jgi:hypothetical protein
MIATEKPIAETAQVTVDSFPGEHLTSVIRIVTRPTARNVQTEEGRAHSLAVKRAVMTSKTKTGMPADVIFAR